jgi:hypothetical protein
VPWPSAAADSRPARGAEARAAGARRSPPPGGLAARAGAGRSPPPRLGGPGRKRGRRRGAKQAEPCRGLGPLLPARPARAAGAGRRRCRWVWRLGAERGRRRALFHARMLPVLVRLLGSGPARLRRRHQASVKRITLNRATSLEAVFFSSCERIRPGSGRQLAIVDRISTDNLRENLPMRHRVCPQCQRERRYRKRRNADRKKQPQDKE